MHNVSPGDGGARGITFDRATIGAAVGLALATVPPFRKMFGTQIPYYDVAPETLLLAVLITVFIGLAGGAVPALRARSMRAVDALRRGGG